MISSCTLLISFQHANFSYSSLYVECLEQLINVHETCTVVLRKEKPTCIHEVSKVTKTEGERLFLSVKCEGIGEEIMFDRHGRDICLYWHCV